jgi:acyl-CoA synthetase (AMP-forming)/AMP-acid ligase II
VGFVPLDIVVVRKGSLPKTPSGKLQRSLCRELYESGRIVRESLSLG